MSTWSTHSPPPSACTPRCSRARWWRCRCTVPNPAAPRRSESKPHCPPCVSMATGPGVWTRWWREEGSLGKQTHKRREDRGGGMENTILWEFRGGSYRWPGTPLWRCVPPPPSSLWRWPKPPVLQGPPPQRVQLWSPSSLRCFLPDRYKRRRLLDGPRATGKRGPWRLLHPLRPGTASYILSSYICTYSPGWCWHHSPLW